MDLLVTLLVGGIVGWLASILMRTNAQMGIIASVIVGVIATIVFFERGHRRIPIQYAISFPERLDSPLPSLNFVELGSLTFEAPDFDNFPCLKYAFGAGKAGATYPAVLNAANEEAVAAFLNREIAFTAISRIIESVIDSHDPSRPENVNVLKQAEEWARRRAREMIGEQGR